MLAILFLNLFIFIFLVFLTIFLPGLLFLSKVYRKINKVEIISLSFCLGIVLFVGLGIILGFIHLRFLLLPTLLILGFLSIIKFRKFAFSVWTSFRTDKLLLLIILAGILMQGFISFPSGYHYKEGLLFWSSQGFDGFWHISIMEEIKKEFPPQIPTFAGEKLVNYHFLSDILMGEFARIFSFFSSLDLYFRFFPVLFSFLMGISVFAFVQKWQNRKIAYWALIFTYFTGSFGYVITFLRNGQLFGGETVFWAAQLNTVIANPPHAVAISLLLSFLLSLLLFFEERKKIWFFITIVCALMIAGFKVSAGVVLLAGLGAAALVDLIVNRKLDLFYLLITLGVSNFAVIKFMTKGVGEYLIWEPWWFIRTMVVAKLDWMDLELRRQHYASKGTWHSWLRVLQIEIMAFSIFLVGNLGMRVIGFIEIFKKILLKKQWLYNKPFEAGILAMMLTGFIIPLFFLQKGIAYNTVQFMQYFLLFFGFYGAIATEKISEQIKNKLFRFLFVMLVIILSVPTVIGNLVEFYGPGKTPLAKISNEEMEALQFLRTHSEEDDIILNPSFDKSLKDRYNSQPFPIYAWYSTGYISGLTGRRTYLSLEEMVIQTGFDYEGRVLKVNSFFEKNDTLANRKLLKEEGISFVYIPKDQLKAQLDLKQNYLDLIFENSEVIIYKVI